MTFYDTIKLNDLQKDKSLPGRSKKVLSGGEGIEKKAAASVYPAFLFPWRCPHWKGLLL